MTAARWRGLALTLALTAAAVPLVAGVAAAPARDLTRQYLITSFDLTAADFRRLAAGQVVARTLPGEGARDITTFGVVRVQVTPEFYVSRVSDIIRFKQDDAVLQIGVFGRPPHLDDISELTLDDADIRDLRGCRVGDCDLQLPADAIARFRSELDWRRPDAAAAANRLMQQVLVEYVTEYQRHGAAAAMHYADRPEPLSLRDEFISLAAPTHGGWQPFAALRQHLSHYTGVAGSSTKDLVYWSKEKVAKRGVASVTHLAIARTADHSPADYAIASKQLYGTHYYDASLGLTVLLRDRAPEAAPAIYVAYVNRSRIDVVGGLFGGVARRLISSRARSTVAEQLARVQQSLQRDFATQGGTRTQ